MNLNTLKLVFAALLFSVQLFSQVGISTSNPEEPLNVFLESDDLEEREAFKAKSKTKLKDLYDYLNIIGNTDLKPDIKNHTISIIKDLFIKDAIVTNIFSSSEPFSLNAFLEKLKTSKRKIIFSITDVELKSNLLVYNLSIKTDNSEMAISVSQKIYWRYKAKQFGNKSKIVLMSDFGSITKLESHK